MKELIEIHENNKKTTCSLCEISFETFLVPHHIWSMHEAIAMQSGIENPIEIDSKNIICSMCCDTMTISHFKKHLENIHNIYPPIKLLKKWSHYTRTKTVIKWSKKPQPKVLNLKDKKKCIYCNIILNPFIYEKHVEKHRKKRTCSFCDEDFFSIELRQKHERTVHGVDTKQVKKYPCHLCEKLFRSPQEVKTHVTTMHDQQKNHLCDLCGDTFGRKSALRKHKNCVHLNLRQYMCKICNKTYKDSSSCKKHLRTVHKVNVVGRLNNTNTGPHMPMVKLKSNTTSFTAGSDSESDHC